MRAADLVVAAQLWMQTQVAWIAEDADRLSDALFEKLEVRFAASPPRRWYAMLLIEAWKQEHLAWWKGEPDDQCRWARPEFLSRYVTDGFLVRPVKMGKKSYPLHWLYAYRMHEGLRVET